MHLKQRHLCPRVDWREIYDISFVYLGSHICARFRAYCSLSYSSLAIIDAIHKSLRIRCFTIELCRTEIKSRILLLESLQHQLSLDSLPSQRVYHVNLRTTTATLFHIC